MNGVVESQACAQRGLLEKQADILTAQRAGILGRSVLHLGGEVEQIEDFVVGEIEIAHQVRRRNFRNGPDR